MKYIKTFELYVKDVLKSQRKIPSQKIIVDKDINGGIVKFDIED